MVRVILCAISILSDALSVVLWPRIWSGSLSPVWKEYSAGCPGGVLYKCQLCNSSLSWCASCSRYDLLRDKRWNLHCNCEHAWFFLQSYLCCRYFEPLLCGAHVFRIMSSWWTEFSDILKCSSLSLVTFIVLKSTLIVK